MSHSLSFSGLIEWFQVSRLNVNHLLKVYQRAPTAETPVCVNIICFSSPCLPLGCRVMCAAGGAAACDHRSWLWLIWLLVHSINTHDKKSEEEEGVYSGLNPVHTSVDIQTSHFKAWLSLLPVFRAPSLSFPVSLLRLFPIFLTIMGGCLWSELEMVTWATPPHDSVTYRLFLQPPVCVPE